MYPGFKWSVFRSPLFVITCLIEVLKILLLKVISTKLSVKININCLSVVSASSLKIDFDYYGIR